MVTGAMKAKRQHRQLSTVVSQHCYSRDQTGKNDKYLILSKVCLRMNAAS